MTGYAMGDGAGVVDEVVDLADDLPVRPVGDGRLRAVRARRRSVRAGRPAPALVRDLVRPPPLRLPRDRPRLPAPAVRRRRLHRTTRSPRSTGSRCTSSTAASSLTFRVGQPARDLARHRSASPRRARGAGRRLALPEGRDLERLAVRSGQYFVSASSPATGGGAPTRTRSPSAPNGALAPVHGQGSRRRLRPRCPTAVGTRVFVEGPYGILTGARRTRRARDADRRRHRDHAAPRPARIPPGGPGDLTLIYRAPPPSSIVFRAELDTLAAHRGATVHYLVGSRRRGDPGRPWPARRSTPPRWPAGADIADQDVYLCGPTGLMRGVEAPSTSSASRAGRCTWSSSPTEPPSVHEGPGLSRRSQRRPRARGQPIYPSRPAETRSCRNAAPSPSD